MKAKKGARWEREFARMLSVWWTKGLRNDVFWRVGGSGARSTQLAKKGQQIPVVGDIMAVDEIGFPFASKVVVELKTGYGDLRVADLLNTKSLLYGWLEKLAKEALRVERQFMLVHRYRRNTIMFLGDDDFWEIQIGALEYPLFRFSVEHTDIWVAILELRTFFEHVKPWG